MRFRNARDTWTLDAYSEWCRDHWAFDVHLTLGFTFVYAAFDVHLWRWHTNFYWGE